MIPKFFARKQGRAGRITLSSPTASQAFDVQACEAMIATLKDWMHDGAVDLVIVDRADGARNFCAAATVMNLSSSARTIGLSALPHLESYAQLCQLISTYPKPYVALIDGKTTGEGLGLSLLGTHQVVTERASLSYSETGYGSIPTAGASYLLPKLRGEIGTWLALTGARVTGADVCAIGLASHYCASKDLQELRKSLIFNGVAALKRVTHTLSFSLEEHRSEIDHAFAGNCADAIKKRLERGSRWTKRQATKLSSKSPLSTKITLRLIRTGTFLDSTKEALKIEHRVLSRLVRSSNFSEGVRAVHVDKDHCPNWAPRSMNHVTYDMVSQYFSPLRDGELCLPEFYEFSDLRAENRAVYA